jgi:hypothetical protein
MPVIPFRPAQPIPAVLVNELRVLEKRQGRQPYLTHQAASPTQNMAGFAPTIPTPSSFHARRPKFVAGGCQIR